jgi:hypothetical protein
MRERGDVSRSLPRLDSGEGELVITDNDWLPLLTEQTVCEALFIAVVAVGAVMGAVIMMVIIVRGGVGVVVAIGNKSGVGWGSGGQRRGVTGEFLSENRGCVYGHDRRFLADVSPMMCYCLCS